MGIPRKHESVKKKNQNRTVSVEGTKVSAASRLMGKVDYTPDGKRVMKTKEFFIRDVPEQLHKEFKAACAYKGISMTQELFRLIRQVIKETDELKEREKAKRLEQEKLEELRREAVKHRLKKAQEKAKAEALEE